MVIRGHVPQPKFPIHLDTVLYTPLHSRRDDSSLALDFTLSPIEFTLTAPIFLHPLHILGVWCPPSHHFSLQGAPLRF